MSEDLPDHTNYSVLKAEDEDGNLVTVLLDSSGAIVSVMKGEYDGVLQTIALDSANRMLARMLPTVEVIIHKDATKEATGSTTVVSSEAVPDGKFWKITNIFCFNTESHVDEISIEPHGYYLQSVFDIPKRRPVIWTGELWLDEGEKIYATFRGTTAGQTSRMYYHGTQIAKV